MVSSVAALRRAATAENLQAQKVKATKMDSVTRFIESAKLHALENPLHAAAASVALLGAAHYLFGSPRSLKVKPQECIIVITGCDTGFGLMSCHRLSKLGYLVVAACLQAQSVESLRGVVALPVQCDVTKEADIRNLVQKTEELARSRNARVWTVVNNAGIANSGCIDWVPSASCRKVMEVNFFALFEVTRAFLPLLKKVKDSRIINISSAAGFSGSYQMGVYCASKHAVEGLGKSLRQELAPWNIHVCHINPGFMNTPILQSAFQASMGDLAQAPQEVLAQYDLSKMDNLKDIIDKLKDDPEKVVNKIVQNVTAARPLFNNPVGNGTYTLWCVLSFVPQVWLWNFMAWANRQQGFGPIQEVVRRLQG